MVLGFGWCKSCSTQCESCSVQCNCIVHEGGNLLFRGKLLVFLRQSQLRLIGSLSVFMLLFYFLAPPSNIITSSDLNVTTLAQLTLNCSADGKPKPTITWTKVSDGTVVTMPLNITGRKDGGGYRCTADNGFGNPLTKVVKITIQCECKKY